MKGLLFSKSWHSVSIALHLLLVFLYASLVLIWARHYEHAVVVPLEKGSNVSTRIVVASQIFVIAYTAALLFLTQRLALQSLILRRHTFTAIHDVASAWTGVGSAVLSLWRQLFIPAAVIGTSGVTVYLLCLSVLHISTPSLFSMAAYNQTSVVHVDFTRGMPQVQNTSTPGSTNPLDVWAAACELLPYLVLVGHQSTLGLENSSVYDILDPNIGIGNVTVGATTANITCGTISNANAMQNSEDEYIWSVDAAYNGYNISFSLDGIFREKAVKQYTWYDELENATLIQGHNAIFVTTFNVVDDAGHNGSYISGYNYTDLQIIGCTMSLQHMNAIVDASTRYVVALQQDASRSADWAAWAPAIQAYAGQYENLQTDSWSDMLESAQSGTYPIATTSSKSTGNPYIDALQTEQYLMQVLSAASNTSAITLKQFENALGDLTASLFWAATHVLPDSTRGDYLEIVRGVTSASLTMSRLNLNLTAIIFGLSASVLLLILGIALTHGASKGVDLQSVDAMGVLQFMWLVSENTPLQSEVARVNEPTTSRLRKAGMVELDSASRMSRGSWIDMTYSPLELKDDRSLSPLRRL
ncbi:uncharacterized protein LAESUDRAFT_242330 [Laetiporus sulphureus 93-53]|uniref:Uncharacterized protein n=1 Tax=Laetiporus sulphureus 93-53 TaxID=1314785 RepID=A0A165DKY5_9APHY|nr:uncharacterized protein LAESUDRAFT_242330 [Laetiporus sulphureus 93-53]KZT05110.1 hypothetical protein LAESUDRAFT_242330 [Laetiporus sulphureus 93-53]